MTQDTQNQDIFAPVFTNMNEDIAIQAKEISLLEVKDLYDKAYDEKDTESAAFKELLAEAVKLDLAYRRQLSKKVAYKDPKQINTFKQACQGSIAQHAAA